MKTIAAREAKANFARLLDDAQREPVTIAKKGRAVAVVLSITAVLIPVQPSPYDIWAASDLVDLIRARQEVTDGKPLAAFVISRAIKGTVLGKEVTDALLEHDLPIFEARTFQRQSYPRTAAEGRTFRLKRGRPSGTVQHVSSPLPSADRLRRQARLTVQG